MQMGNGVLVLTGLLAALWLGTQLKRAWFPSDADKTPLPFPIQVTEKFATKEELLEVKLEIKELERALPETERRILSAIERSADKITKTVNKMAEVASAGRRKLYDKDIVHSQELSSLGTKTAALELDLREFKRQF